MKRIIRLTESDLTRIVKRVIRENASAMISQMKKSISSADPLACKGTLLQNFNALKKQLGYPADGGCVGDSLSVAWPKGSKSRWYGWQVQCNQDIENIGKKDESIITNVAVIVDYSDNRKLKALENSNFYSNAKVNFTYDTDGNKDWAIIEKNYSYDQSPFDDLDDILTICNAA
jgi:hypothetical protein